jgi:outer membrane receptor protein involved in Fe transport
VKEILLALVCTTPLAAQLTLPDMVVSASRAPTPASSVPFSVTALSGETLRTTPTATLDGALRSVPGFSLFRRSDSLSANPTAQGVSLRGLGPSGASRSLVVGSPGARSRASRSPAPSSSVAVARRPGATPPSAASCNSSRPIPQVGY